jgi:hypothetical protein
MLRRCEFGGKWRSWIAYCVSLMRFSILVNCFSTCFFSSSCGLRLGDPLSPLLFVKVMEALGMMISDVVSGGLLSGFSMGTRTYISHILFSDDALIFCGATHIIYAFYGVYSYYLKLCWV